MFTAMEIDVYRPNLNLIEAVKYRLDKDDYHVTYWHDTPIQTSEHNFSIDGKRPKRITLDGLYLTLTTFPNNHAREIQDLDRKIMQSEHYKTERHVIVDYLGTHYLYKL